jgi:hypothetical protein
MQTLVDLVKLGAIGASLAFLLLSFRLLSRVLKPGGPAPSADVLREIRRFRRSALVFLVVGIVSEFFISHGVEILASVNQLIFKDQLVRVRFNDWDYTPQDKLLSFGFEENRANTRSYILPAMKDQYDVYVAVRQKGVTSFDHGDFKLVYGPYHFGNQGRIDHTLSAEELGLLGNGCVEFTVFGVPKVDGKMVQLQTPFNPDKLITPVSAFHAAGVCP